MRSLRIGLAQFNPTVGDLDGNFERIVAAIGRARSLGVEVLALPELAITGYPPEDLLLRPSFVERAVQRTRDLVPHSAGMTLVVGTVERDEEVLRFDAAKSGRWLAVLPLLALVLAPLAGRWSDRIGTRALSVAGMLLAAAGFAVMSQVGVTPHPGHILGGMALIGAGVGIFTVPNSSAAMGSVPPERLGLASGLQATMRNLGIASGAAAMAAIVASRFAAHGGGTLAASAQGGATHPLAFALATRDAYLVMAAVALAAAALSLRQAGATQRDAGTRQGS